MLHLDAERIHGLSDYPGLVSALKDMNKRGVDLIDRMLLSQPTRPQGQNDWLLLPAWSFDRYFGIKLVSVFPDNPQQGHPAVQGIYALFEGRKGAAIATLDGAALTLVKTAANSAMASDLLSRKDSHTLLVCGGGALAPHLIAAHCAMRPIKRVLWWNRRPETLDLAPLRAAGLPVEVVTELAVAAAQADIISTATRATAPLIEGTWLKPGCHLDLVGGYLPEMREADDAAFRRAPRHYIDARLTTVGVAGDICAPLAAGLTSEDALIDMFQLNRGERPGRQDDQEITWFKSGGGGHEDLAVAQYLYERDCGAN
ncbi:ornithine cyclodeaminase family protein [Dongia rigui]|uniref:Ornithine cyclodeaminase family protein n=1 Tax=Dongia rigui TaxID=940149 RepID=A0ABU5E2P0_9PROT|nr:ornithine cyclodeaminase family protein [Dongia rigui]MDY0873455.1 ornithine cyclodeaminase family protein [Dongia rigui]